MSSLITDRSSLSSSLVFPVDDIAFIIPPTTQLGLQSVGKRGLDIVISALALFVLAPLFLGVALVILLETGRPVFFAQVRVRAGGKPFTVYKFRSMYRDAELRLAEVLPSNQIKDGPIFKMKADPRITPFGRFLRRTSIDELPQLFNVLKGEMSLVGPRPPLASEVRQYADWQLRRLSVKPGMTGLWQVSGRSNLSFSEMVRLDIEYVENWSLGYDLVLLMKTPIAVLQSRGAY